ncbi:hypothetical protein IQ07DRAFT_649856 [Pyrenochaeta sp. DS3sAY3a]|nr:hypothetical protein IQ07DRAFT_649856 [Pyrenochaeta sp. DS3sAY3a]
MGFRGTTRSSSQTTLTLKQEFNDPIPTGTKVQATVYVRSLRSGFFTSNTFSFKLFIDNTQVGTTYVPSMTNNGVFFQIGTTGLSTYTLGATPGNRHTIRLEVMTSGQSSADNNIFYADDFVFKAVSAANGLPACA